MQLTLGRPRFGLESSGTEGMAAGAGGFDVLAAGSEVLAFACLAAGSGLDFLGAGSGFGFLAGGSGFGLLAAGSVFCFLEAGSGFDFLDEGSGVARLAGVAFAATAEATVFLGSVSGAFAALTAGCEAVAGFGFVSGALVLLDGSGSFSDSVWCFPSNAFNSSKLQSSSSSGDDTCGITTSCEFVDLGLKLKSISI